VQVAEKQKPPAGGFPFIPGILDRAAMRRAREK
jgi:hypothetical protein